ncbi:hypothetical protein PICSAR135_00927 [Mycobacterium avium subsp. paratuberculosis]|nr:hypothetical protein PICSAR135_00927 [Mycobacterium avium subsp. paratuberculosis]CAG7044641.1 hypothetical protein PICSAR2_00227 [Mycobacterium avium subsp. paratuberculosis]CAG7230799.1 hypothetical protein PICSAR4_00457 [Mycobacterium avium subsp. paratuberculosis]CAG7249812.1 hypothetical protein PICSAR5_01300 [Mycobacterium avium subsp. paratuberculosis]CAG7314600.1 hypothetical protein PICSAR6_02146 [Mycobacterium avium subsp. paratuberculosis]
MGAPTHSLCRAAVYQGVRYSSQGVASIPSEVVAGWASTRAMGLASRRSRRSRPDGPSASRSIVTGVACARKNGTT